MFTKLFLTKNEVEYSLNILFVPFISSDMSFLEQHFYVDAGVSFPIDHIDTATSHTKQIAFAHTETKPTEHPTVVSDSLNIENLSETEIKLLQNSTTNITDDVKVNLRNITRKEQSKIIPPKIYVRCDQNQSNVKKRHSSIFSSSCLDEQNRKNTNRRSLNIQSRDFSKIPISSKKQGSSRKSKSQTNICKCTAENDSANNRDTNDSLAEIDSNGLYSVDDHKNNTKENVVPSRSSASISNSKLESSLRLSSSR